MTPDEAFRLAMAHHQAGALDQATALYAQLFETFPNHPKLLELYGTALLQQRRFEDGVKLVRQALALLPDNVELWINCGHGLLPLGLAAEALACFERAAALAPDNADAHDNAGRVLEALGRTEDAVEAFGRAIDIRPNDGGLFFNRGLMRFRLDRFEDALADFQRASSLRPGFAEARLQCAETLARLGRRDEALAEFAAVIAAAPTADAYRRRGDFYRTLRRSREALDDYDRAAALAPDDVVILCARADRSIILNRHETALDDCSRAIALRPDFAPAHNLRGLVLTALDREVEALECFDRAAALDPEHAEIYLNNRGNALCNLRRYDEALAAFEAAVAHNPDYAEAHANVGLIHLRRGDFAAGWPRYEWRWKVEYKREAVRNFLNATMQYYRDTLWTGEQDLTGKTVLLHAEQGLGDIVQFCRYVPMVAAKGATVIVETREPILSLLATLPCPCRFRVLGKDKAVSFDFHCPILSLPSIFATTLETVPNAVPYLAADPAKRIGWQAKLGGKTRPRIGLVWSGAPQHEQDRQRSAAMRSFAPLLALPFDFHCLQKEIRESDRAALAEFPQVALHEAELHDFSDTAALIAEMDLTISVDTSVAHVAGSLGLPVWILIQWAAEWRWMIDRADTPWYPTARLFRQGAPGDWDGVIQDVCTAATEWFSGGSGP